MFQHILVALDGSSRAEQALPIATRIARFTGGSLFLVQVVRPPLDYSGGLYTPPLEIQEEINEEMASATAYLQTLATSEGLAGIDTRTEVLFGLPAQQLLAFSATSGIDLLVLCSHGRTGFTRWIRGSVAHALVHQCPLPLLILHQRETFAAFAPIDTAGPFRTLVPLDGSLRAEVALRPAAYVTAALAGAGQGTLHLSQVLKSSPTSVEERGSSERNQEAVHQVGTYLSQIEERVASEEKNLQLTLTHSVKLAPDVASALLALAEHEEGGETRESGVYDLIAISTHGRGGLERWVMGSVTERILNTTKLPLLIVRPSKAG